MSNSRPETPSTLYPAYALERRADAVEAWHGTSAAVRFLESLPLIAQRPDVYIAQAEQAKRDEQAEQPEPVDQAGRAEQAEQVRMASIAALDFAFQHAMEQASNGYSVTRAALVAAQRRRSA